MILHAEWLFFVCERDGKTDRQTVFVDFIMRQDYN